MASDRAPPSARLSFEDVVTRPATGVPERGARLTVFGAVNLSHPVPDGTVLTIGRATEADLCLDDPALSRIHAQLTFGSGAPGGGLMVRDLNSRNGTRLRGAPLAANVDHPFDPGDLIDVGHCTLVVQRGVSLERPRRVWTHGYFQLRLEDECKRARASGRSLAVLRVRLAGRGPSPDVEAALTALLGTDDVIGEYAPGEYDILLTNSPPDAAAQAVQGIRFTLGRLDAEVDVGMACLPQDGQDSEALMATAGAGVRKASVRAQDHAAFVVKNRAMKQLHELIDRIAPSELTVLVLGETGAGKEVIAKSVHQRSTRSEAPFVALNCGAFPEELLESELFGHEKGAFTGAVKAKPGLLESAQGGTVFLDEVAEMSLTTQVKLLRVIEDRQVRRLGGLVDTPLDVRLIAATNKDLTKLIEQGGFREDLYYRINGMTLVVPALRERPDEIPLLAAFFARQALLREGSSRTAEFTEETMARLCAYSWPGNVRELKNVIERAVVLAGDGPIQGAHLPTEKLRASVIYERAAVSEGQATPPPVVVPSPPVEASRPVESPSRAGVEPLKDAVAALERDRIVAALEQCAGNQSKAAKLLGMSRKSFIRRLDHYNIPRPRKGRS